jgi:hypothetical protein
MTERIKSLGRWLRAKWKTLYSPSDEEKQFFNEW